MPKILAPAKTPGVAIARVLRGLGLKQGSDFRVKGEYKNGERTGTRVVVLGRSVNQTVADNANLIEQQAAEAGFPFNVSVYFTPSGIMWVHVANYGKRTRQTHFLSPVGRTENVDEAAQLADSGDLPATGKSADSASGPEAEQPKPVIRATLGASRPAFGTPTKDQDEFLAGPRSGKTASLDLPKGQRVQGVDSYGVTCMGTVNGVAWGAVTDPSHANYGRTWVDVEWDEMPHNRGTGRRSRPFTDELIKH